MRGRQCQEAINQCLLIMDPLPLPVTPSPPSPFHVAGPLPAACHRNPSQKGDAALNRRLRTRTAVSPPGLSPLASALAVPSEEPPPLRALAGPRGLRPPARPPAEPVLTPAPGTRPP